MKRFPQSAWRAVGLLLVLGTNTLSPVSGQESNDPHAVRFAYGKQLGEQVNRERGGSSCGCPACSLRQTGEVYPHDGGGIDSAGYPATPVLDSVIRGGHGVVATTREYLALAFRNTAMDGRYIGLGDPLVASSWLNRPYHVGWRTGALFGDSIQSDRVTQDPTLMFGLQLGADLDHYFGTEWRLAWASPKLNSQTMPQYERTGELFWTDINAMYYPWGDSRVRPFASIGLGLTEVDFRDEQGVRLQNRLFSVPIGIGIKHFWRRWLSWRFDVSDNLAFSGGAVDTMHNVTATFGVEVHFGVRPRSYWPWYPDRHHR